MTERRDGQYEMILLASLVGRHEQSVFPSDRNHKSWRKSLSPTSNSRARDEMINSRGIEERDDEDDSVAKMKTAGRGQTTPKSPRRNLPSCDESMPSK